MIFDIHMARIADLMIIEIQVVVLPTNASPISAKETSKSSTSVPINNDPLSLHSGNKPFLVLPISPPISVSVSCLVRNANMKSR